MNEYKRLISDIPLMIMLCGLPGSGKSTYAETISVSGVRPIIHSSDSLREELWGNESTQGDNNKLFRILHKRIKDDLIAGKDVVYDATNINKKQRKQFLDEISKIECYPICVCIMAEIETCLINNSNRARIVPEDAIRRMFMNWQPPHYGEGFGEIKYVFTKSYNSVANHIRDFTLGSFFKVADNFDQENSHHKLTLGEHCTKSALYIQENAPNNFLLLFAAMLHDNGKIFTKTRTNAKGIFDGECHYYQHHCCGAYESLFYLNSAKQFSDADMVYVSNLIYYHMHPYNEWKQSEKALNRDRKLLGEKMFNDILLLHDADVYAH